MDEKYVIASMPTHVIDKVEFLERYDLSLSGLYVVYRLWAREVRKAYWFDSREEAYEIYRKMSTFCKMKVMTIAEAEYCSKLGENWINE